MKKKKLEIAVVEMPFEPMSIDEVAAFTKYQKSYLYQLVKRKEIPVHTWGKGRKLIFNKPDVIKWMTSIRRASIEELTASVGICR